MEWLKKRREAQSQGRIVVDTENEMVEYLDGQGYEARIFHFDAGDSGFGYLVFWVAVSTDREKDELITMNLEQKVREMLYSAGYPAEAAARACLAVESEETVKRDYSGNWWYAIK